MRGVRATGRTALCRTGRLRRRRGRGPKEEKERIRRTKFNGKSEDKKFMQMVAYLFELGYDLALSRIHNVSQSPGFEGCGLIFDKKEFDRRLGYLALQDFDD